VFFPSLVGWLHPSQRHLIMAKDSYWFKHDSTAGRGLRMRKMAHIYGHWGKGVYWDVIEILRDQAGYKFDYDDSSLQMLCDLIGCKDEPKFMSWMRDCVQIDLFQVSKGKFFSAILAEFCGCTPCLPFGIGRMGGIDLASGLRGSALNRFPLSTGARS